LENTHNDLLSVSNNKLSSLEKTRNDLRDKVQRLKKQNSQVNTDVKISNLNMEINNLRDENILLEKRITHSDKLLRDKITKLVQTCLEKDKLSEHIKFIENDYRAQFDKVNASQAELTLRYKKYVNMERYKYWKYRDKQNYLYFKSYRVFKWVFDNLEPFEKDLFVIPLMDMASMPDDYD